jgi:hypothetical protein
MVHKFTYIVYLYMSEKSCNIDGEEIYDNVKTTKWSASVSQIMAIVLRLMLPVFFNIIVILPVTTCGGLTRFVGPCHHAY